MQKWMMAVSEADVSVFARGVFLFAVGVAPSHDYTNGLARHIRHKDA